MPIGPLTMLALYIICWWAVLFAVLPLGTSRETHEPPTDGRQWGAPETPNLKRKFITTTWVALIVWMVIMLFIYMGWMPIPNLMPPPVN